FEADFGRTEEEFIENLSMPEELLGLRGHFVELPDESIEDRNRRYTQWEINHSRIGEWTRLYRSLGDNCVSNLELIKDNDFSMDTFKAAKTPTLKKMFVHNLSFPSILRNIEILGFEMLTYLKIEFPKLYGELLKYVIHSKYTQYSCLKGMLTLQGTVFIVDVIKAFIEDPYLTSNIFIALYKAQKELKKVVLDTRGLDIALRFKTANLISHTELKSILRLGLECDGKKIQSRLYQKSKQVNEAPLAQNQEETANRNSHVKIGEIINLLEKIDRQKGN
ncbi:MAG: hypothetical protein GXY29_05610, partial [Thermotogaceae bacterium]|nr:hypothetical protein [Thermotogaceae bacterium]